MAEKKITELEERLIRFDVGDNEAWMYDVNTNEILWSMDLEDNNKIRAGLYELMSLITGQEVRSKITFPGLERLERGKRDGQ